MWNSRCLTTIWAFTACYRGSFTLFFFTAWNSVLDFLLESGISWHTRTENLETIIKWTPQSCYTMHNFTACLCFLVTNPVVLEREVSPPVIPNPSTKHNHKPAPSTSYPQPVLTGYIFKLSSHFLLCHQVHVSQGDILLKAVRIPCLSISATCPTHCSFVSLTNLVIFGNLHKSRSSSL
jgi:hypothetical protein